MKETKNKNVFVKLLLHMAGVLLCVVPPAVCTLSYFPLWKSAGYVSCISGGVAFLLVLCAIPIFKALRRAFANAASYVMWLLLFIAFFLLSKIAYEMTVISFVGFVGNLLGAVCFALATRAGGEK